MLVFAGAGIYTLGVACIAALAVTGVLATRRGLALALVAALIEAAALVGPDWSRFLLLHGHNCLALAVWLAWRKRPTRVSIAVAACFVAGTVAIAIGCFDGLVRTRALYVTASEFHATVEAILVTVVLARGAPPRGGRDSWNGSG